MRELLRNLLKDEQGQDLVEYAALIALIALAVTGGMTTLATGINDALTDVAAKITAKL